MKIVQINATCGAGSTGKICMAISELLDEKNIENYIFYTQGESNYKNGIKYAKKKYIKIQACKMILQDFAKSVVSCECQSTTIKPAGLPAQKTPQTGVLEYQWSDVSDVSDKSDG